VGAADEEADDEATDEDEMEADDAEEASESSRFADAGGGGELLASFSVGEDSCGASCGSTFGSLLQFPIINISVNLSLVSVANMESKRMIDSF
jgi:hypothetical protein